MKKVALFIAVSILHLISTAQSPTSFTLQTISSSNSITCYNPFVQIIAYNTYSLAPLTYNWTGPNASYTGSNVSISSPGIYTVTGMAQNSSSSSQTLAIGINTLQAPSFVSPLVQNINCGNVGTFTCSIVTPSIFATHKILSPLGTTAATNSSIFYFSASVAGTYTHILTNFSNGCETIKTFTINSSLGFPTFGLQSPQNFKLGCGSSSVVSVAISNAVTSPTAGGPVSYTLQGLINTGSYTMNTPGTFTAIVRDNTTLCEAKLPFTVIQDNNAPNIQAWVPTQILDCNFPSSLLQGFSSTPSVSFKWTFNGTQSSTLNPINSNTITATPTSSVAGIYTLEATNNSNSCKSYSIIPIYQNIFKPNAHISSVGVAQISCDSPTVMLVNSSTSGIPNGNVFSNNLPVQSYSWSGPPIAAQPLTNTYVASVVGDYTLTVKDLNNGCLSSTIILVEDNRFYPVLDNPGPFLIVCPDGTVAISPIINGGSHLTYSWIVPMTATVNGVNSASLITNAIGTYSVTITNTLNGCASIFELIVSGCVGLKESTFLKEKIKIFPNPVKDKLKLETQIEIKEIKIINALGQMVAQINYPKNNQELNLSFLSPGVYYLRVLSADGVGVLRVLRE